MQRPFPAYTGDQPYLFVCYAHEDAAVVYPEMVRLHESGCNLWYDEGISPGQSWRDEIALSIMGCRGLLLFASANSIASSNCLKELNFALSRDRKIIAVHLESISLPAGLDLSLSDVQAIIRYNHSAEDYERKLQDGIRSLMGSSAHARSQPQIAQPITGPSIAILPLVNRSSDPDNEYLCDGIAEELIGGLASLDGLKVASQLSSFSFKNQHLDVRVMGERLGVKHILSGSVQKAGNRVRIGFLLSRVDDGTTLWSSRYDRELGDIFELQGTVAATVIDALKLELTTGERQQLRNMGTTNGEAYETYLQGLHAARRGTRESLEKAVGLLQQATRLDPMFARAYWWLYFCYWRMIGVGESRAEMERKGEAALNRSRDLGFLPPVPWIKARRDLMPQTRPDQRTLALEACEKIRAPDPEWRGFEYVQLGECLLAVGLDHTASACYEHFIDSATQDLSATWIPSRYRSILTQTDDWEKAIAYLTRSGIPGKTLVYARTGQYAQAKALLAAEERASGFNIYQFCLFLWQGDTGAAMAYFDGFDADALWLLEQYWVSFLTGDLERGLDLLEQDVALGAQPAVFRSNLREVLLPGTVAALEAHPRFQAILQQFGIDEAWRTELMTLVEGLSDLSRIRIAAEDVCGTPPALI